MNEKQNLRLKRNVGLDYVHTFLSNMNMQSSIWVLYLAYCGLHLAQIGLLEGIYHATSIVCEIPSGAAADLLGRKRCMILSNLCIVVSCVIMLFSKSFGWFAVSFAVQALGNNLNSGSEEALVYDSMKCLGQEEHYMGVYGRLNVLIEVAQGLATVAGGVLAEFSYFWCYAACVVIAVLALLPVLWMAERGSCGGRSSGTENDLGDREASFCSQCMYFAKGCQNRKNHRLLFCRFCGAHAAVFLQPAIFRGSRLQ